MSMPDVSVVLPVYNARDTVSRAARSILCQTLRDIELVVVDDGSTDGTPQVLQGLDDPRLRVVSTSHQGVARAANVATEHASAPILARMDADDFSHPQRLEKQLAWLKSRQLDVVGCQVHIVDATGGEVPSLQRYQRWINEETLTEEAILALRFVELPLVNPTILARRRYFELGFSTGATPEDYDLMLRAAARGMSFGKVDEILFDWTDHPRRLSRASSQYSADAFQRCRRAHLVRGPLREAERVDLWGVGPTGKRWLRWLQSKDIVIRWAYDVHPRKTNEHIHGVPVRHPTAMPPADGTPMIIAVGAAGARQLVGPHLRAHGYCPGQDAWFVA